MVAVYVALGLLALYLLVLAVATWASIHPLRVLQYISPGMLGFPQEDVEFTTDDGIRLSGWLSRGREDLVVIGVHGYIMNRCEWVPFQQALAPTKATFLYFDLRAHGRSGGRVSTLGKSEALDVEAAIRFARSLHPKAKIVLLGSSMGGAACVYAAATEGVAVDGLALDGAFHNLEEAAKGWWPFLLGAWAGPVLGPTRWLGALAMGFHPRTVQIEPALGVIAGRPILFLYGTRDPIVPQASANKNLEAAGCRARLEWFEGATHGTGRVREPERFGQELLRLVQEVDSGNQVV